MEGRSKGGKEWALVGGKREEGGREGWAEGGVEGEGKTRNYN